MYEEKYEFQLYLYAKKGKKKSPFVPYVIKLFPIFHLFFLSFFEKWNQESFCVEWL